MSFFVGSNSFSEDKMKLESGRIINVKQEITAQGSKGNLKKWYAEVNGVPSYIKTNSNPLNENEGLECRSEVICGNIAKLMNLSTVQYELDYLFIDGLQYEVCISADFTEANYNYTTIAKVCNKATKFFGKEKYDYVISMLPDLKNDIDTILAFDSIINNHDRHLNNFMLKQEEVIKMCPCFDYGDSLFSTIPLNRLQRAFELPLNYTQSKPFGSVHRVQMKLIGVYNLEPISLPEVYRIVNKYLEPARAKLINKWLSGKLQELNLEKEGH